MLAIGFEAAAFATNCYVLATAAGQECLVVDPGIGVLDTLASVLEEYRLRPAAVLLTHGHADHVYSVTPVCGAHGVPAVIHADDRYRLVDPLRTLDPQLVAMLEAQFGEAAAMGRAGRRPHRRRRRPPRPGRAGRRGAARSRAHRGVGDVRPRRGARRRSGRAGSS